ncbi:MAG: hypothetical protein IJF18_08245, partial [Oscillospiraceae bacterium]|nr:hypothetical protein [Oscillospiraceae bacterium]
MFRKIISGIMAIAVCVVGLSGCGKEEISVQLESETTIAESTSTAAETVTAASTQKAAEATAAETT